MVGVGIGRGKIKTFSAVSSGRASSGAVTVTIVVTSVRSQFVCVLVVDVSPFRTILDLLAGVIPGQSVAFVAGFAFSGLGARASPAALVAFRRRVHAFAFLQDLGRGTAGAIAVGDSLAGGARRIAGLAFAVDQGVA